MADYNSSYTGSAIDACINTYQNATDVQEAINIAIETDVQDAIDTAIDTAIATDVQDAINTAIAAAKLAMYPIGSIYMSVESTDPTTFIGGTWERLQDRFLLGTSNTYANGATGGEATHILTIDETPAHTHTRGTMNITGQWKIKGDANNAGVDAPATGSGAFSPINETASGSSPGGTGWSCGTGFNFNAASNWTGETSSVGGGPPTTTCRPILPYICGSARHKCVGGEL